MTSYVFFPVYSLPLSDGFTDTYFIVKFHVLFLYSIFVHISPQCIITGPLLLPPQIQTIYVFSFLQFTFFHFLFRVPGLVLPSHLTFRPVTHLALKQH